jgi:ATP/maltotriose-dependent transcriptional regulator MalT
VGSVVFREQVRRPEPSGLSRDRLARPLLDATGPGGVLLLAPAGSGKTTLLAQIAGTPGTPTAWYRARPEDRSEDALVRHVTEALAVVLPEALNATTADQLILATETGVPTTCTSWPGVLRNKRWSDFWSSGRGICGCCSAPGGRCR